MPQPHNRCGRLRPSSRASFAVGVLWANTAEDREDRRRAEVRPLPGGAGEHVEHPAAAFAAVVDDRGIGATAVDVEAVAGGASGAGQPLGMEQVQELLVAGVSVHQVDDREIHGVASLGKSAARPDRQETRKADGVKGPTTKFAT